MLDWLKRMARHQWTDTKAVLPEVRFVGGTFYLNSEAGLIRFTPKGTKDLTAFRDKYVNRFTAVTKDYNRKALFALYGDIRTEVKRVSYRGNVRTRLRLATGFMLVAVTMVSGCATDGLADRVQQLEEKVAALEASRALEDASPPKEPLLPTDCD